MTGVCVFTPPNLPLKMGGFLIFEWKWTSYIIWNEIDWFWESGIYLLGIYYSNCSFHIDLLSLSLPDCFVSPRPTGRTFTPLLQDNPRLPCSDQGWSAKDDLKVAYVKVDIDGIFSFKIFALNYKILIAWYLEFVEYSVYKVSICYYFFKILVLLRSAP